MNLIQTSTTALRNVHVSIPLALALVCEAGKIWFPQYAIKFDATQKLLYTYGVLAASLTGSQREDRNLS